MLQLISSLFVKCGSVIPMLSEIPESTMTISNKSLSLFLAVPDKTGTYVSKLYEDDGLTRGLS